MAATTHGPPTARGLEGGLGLLLEEVAATVAGTLGFGTVAVNLYRPAWDDFRDRHRARARRGA